MKKLSFLCMFAMLFITSALAQTEHLTFKGIPINGTLTEFVNRMKSAGYTYLGQEDGIGVMQGDFAGCRNCDILVATYKPTGNVSMVVVLFTTYNDWGDLEGNYNSLKSMLTLKYGEPSEVIEEFQGYEPNTNNGKMHKLTMDQCIWGSLFSTEAGDIELSITKLNYTSGRVMLRYRDRDNTNAVKEQAINDL